ncbi:helix-turn-helix domain-containing protein [Nocardia sp. CDC159]|uniref:Helix-turn-helix domain-containing protein n=1 Tax=Nocardia pulmonis TaxID=2951408 RepID=A0A9X2J0L8_9NOCA|nr:MULTISPECIES: helix-turn-helix transcriptional regulator [Nocardia]MCM6777969.1 helix-turn-helix domain-containing protein [Nocardia pulmonis]MCM6790860.1 helix-turn-helix domain-containing protein [Nocardia sp. CDC159]
MKEDDEPTLARRQLGKYLRDGRNALGLTLEQAGAAFQRSASTLQRIEKGVVVNLRDVDIEALCRIYEFDEEKTAAMLALAVQGNELSWWREYSDLFPRSFEFFVGLEATADRVTTYESELVPGLLQTPAYASALIHAVFPDDTAEEHARRLELRRRRQVRIKRKYSPLKIDAILRESVLRGVVGGPRVMAGALRHLADLGTLPHVNVQILPFSAGSPLGLPISPFVVLDFGKDRKGRSLEPPLVYVEHLTGELYLTRSTAVERYHDVYESLRRSALDPAASRALLRQMAREYGS